MQLNHCLVHYHLTHHAPVRYNHCQVRDDQLQDDVEAHEQAGDEDKLVKPSEIGHLGGRAGG